MMLVLCTQVPGQSNHQSKPSRSRPNGWSQSGPLDRYLRTNLMLALCIGKCREASSRDCQTTSSRIPWLGAQPDMLEHPDLA